MNMKRILSFFIAFVMLFQLMPLSLAVDGGTTEPEEATGLEIKFGDTVVVKGGERIEEQSLPADVGFTPATTDSSVPVLTLTNAADLPRLKISGGALKIQLVGDSAINVNDESALRITEGAAVTISGSGSLEVTAPSNRTAIQLLSSTLTVTGGCTLTAETTNPSAAEPDENTHDGVALDGNGSLTVDNATLNLRGTNYGTLLAGDMTFTNCTVNVNRIHVHSDVSNDSPNAPRSTTVFGDGAVINIMPKEDDKDDPVLMVLDGSTLKLKDGSSVNVDTTALTALDSAIGAYTDPDDRNHRSSIEIDGGSLNLRTGDSKGINLVQYSDYKQTGGNVTLNSVGGETGGTPLLCTGADSMVEINGGTLTGSTVRGGIYLEGRGLSMTGGTVNINAYRYGMVADYNSTIEILGGMVETSAADPDNAAGIFGYGDIKLTGGIIRLNSARYSLIGFGDVTLGDGMYAVANGQQIGLTEAEGGLCLPSQNVVISNQRGSAAATSLTLTSGQPTAGSAFHVRAVMALEKSEKAVFSLPSDVALIKNSVTVNGNTVSDYTYNESKHTLTLSVNPTDIVRFSGIASEEGAHTITLKAGNETESLSFQVKPFTLSLPTQTSTPDVVVSGMAAPNSVIELYRQEGDNDVSLGTVTATALGTWKITITLPEQSGTYTVWAKTDKGAVSEKQLIYYDSACAEVKTLTVRTHLHDSLGQVFEESVVIDYQQGTTSSHFYTYMPEEPEFTFEVVFGGNTSAVQNPQVVTTNYAGESSYVNLTQVSSTLWRGTYNYDDRSAPQYFRVEWDRPTDAGAVTDTEELPDEGDESYPPKKDEPKKEDELHPDGLLVKATAGESFTLEVNDLDALTVTDAAEIELDNEEENATDTFKFTPKTGQLYIATLSNGTFPDYEDYNTLYILACGGAGGKSPYPVLKEGVEINEDTRTATDENGNDLEYLEDIYESLSFNPADLETGDINFNDADLEALEDAFRETQAYQAAAYAIAMLDAEDDDEQDEVSVDAQIDVNISITNDGAAQLQLCVVFDVGGCLQFKFDIKKKLRFNVQVDDGKLQQMYFIEDQTNTLTVTATVKGDNSSESELEVNLKKYFKETPVADLTEQVLEQVEIEDKDDMPITLGERFLPSTIPGVGLTLRLDLELEFSWEGELTGTFTLEQTQNSGFIYCKDSDNPIQVFGSIGEPEESAEAAFHATMESGAYLKAYIGPSVLNVINATLYGKAGLGIVADGHGEISTSNPDPLIELYIGLLLKGSYGVNAEMRLKNIARIYWEKELGSITIPLWSAGSKVMPTDFTVQDATRAAPLLVTGDCDLKQIIDLKLNYMSFESQNCLGEMDSIPIACRKFADNRYSFKLTANSQGKGVSIEGSTLKLPENLGDESIDFEVLVSYEGYGEDYILWKIVPMRYVSNYFTIVKEIQGATKVATFQVTDLDTNESLGTYTTNTDGIVMVPADTGHRYLVTELSCAAGYLPVLREQIITVEAVTKTDTDDEDNEKNVLTFVNVKTTRPRTPDVFIPDIRDPSGFVYEGVETNRLSGVTATLYYKASENTTEIQVWNAEPFLQHNPLTTNTLGQFYWNVPNGWWQVKFEKDGYETAYSDWLPVPPTQTGLKISMVSKAAATLSVTASESRDSAELQFSKPMQISTITDRLTVTVNGREVDGNLIPLDANGTKYAMKFRFVPFGTFTAGAALTVSVNGAETYAGTAVSTSVTIQLPKAPHKPSHSSKPSHPSTSATEQTPDNDTAGTDIRFTDIPHNAWYASAVAYVSEKGIMAGNNGCFSPNMALSRGMMAQILYNIEGSAGSFSLVYPDVLFSDWYANAVSWVSAHGIMSGYGSGLFGANDSLTREQLALTLYQYAQVKGYDISAAAELTSFVDDHTTSDWARPAMQWAVANGLISGKSGNRLDPQGTATRAEVAQILMNFAEKIAK